MILLSLTSQVQQILIALVIIPKYRTRPMERALTTTAGTMLVIITRIIIIKRILVALKHKKGGKDKYYRLY